MIPFMSLLISLILAYARADTLNIDQPSIITWQKNDKISALIIKSINLTNLVMLQKLESLPFQVATDQTTSSIQAKSSTNVTIYRTGNVLLTATIDYYYKSYNGTSQISQLTSNSTESTIQQLSAHPTLTDFTISPKTSSTISSFPNSSIIMATDKTVYVLTNAVYSQQSKCGTLSKINQQMMNNTTICNYLQPKNIIYRKMFTFQTLNLISEVDNKLFSLPYSSPRSTPITLSIKQNILGTNLNVQPLASHKVNLNQVTFDVKTQKTGTSYQVVATLSNSGSQLAFIALQATQGEQIIHNQLVILQPISKLAITFPISKSSPFDDIVFNITNPLTSQYYTFNKPTSIIQDSSQTSYQLIGQNFIPYSSISVGVLAAIICGGSVLVIISFVGFVFYRKKRLQQKVKLNLQGLKSSIKSTAAPTYPSQRQFIKDQFSIQNRVSINLVKEKPQTCTTLASQNLTNSQQYEPNQIKVPSLQDKLEIRESLDDLEAKISKPYKSTKRHRRTASTLPILPPLYQSAEHVDPYLERDLQNLDKISV